EAASVAEELSAQARELEAGVQDLLLVVGSGKTAYSSAIEDDQGRQSSEEADHSLPKPID
ncbi:MAG: hypothetical protein ACLFPB_07555, partial [Desulfovermiculus sp.]